MDVHLVELLSHFGWNSDTAANRGWKALSNGQLVAAAVTQGFTCLLTRDRLFAESAAKALGLLQSLGVVLVNLPQQRWPAYREHFLRAWRVSPIMPQVVAVILWPEAELPKDESCKVGLWQSHEPMRITQPKSAQPTPQATQKQPDSQTSRPKIPDRFP